MESDRKISPNACNSQVWTRQKPGPRNYSPSTRVFSSVFPGILTGNWIESRATEAPTGTHVGASGSLTQDTTMPAACYIIF